jgi:formate dehydrogenase major subunit
MQKLARAVIGTNNMDNCSRYCQAPATQGLFRTVGYGGDSGSIRDIENAGLVLIIGSNTAEAHPLLATRVKRAHKLRGQKLIVSDLREHEMAKRADLFLRPKPGTDIVWLSAGEPPPAGERHGQHQVSGSMGEWIRKIQEEPRAVHYGVCR